MKTPCKGQSGIYKSPTNGNVGFIVRSVDGNICLAEYDDDKGKIQPFIWRFKDGYNILHHFHSTDAMPAQAHKTKDDRMGDLFA